MSQKEDQHRQIPLRLILPRHLHTRHQYHHRLFWLHWWNSKQRHHYNILRPQWKCRPQPQIKPIAVPICGLLHQQCSKFQTPCEWHAAALTLNLGCQIWKLMRREGATNEKHQTQMQGVRGHGNESDYQIGWRLK
jgi:hypothetical protein